MAGIIVQPHTTHACALPLVDGEGRPQNTLCVVSTGDWATSSILLLQIWWRTTFDVEIASVAPATSDVTVYLRCVLLLWNENTFIY